jgi:hypothetical protein
MEWSYASQLVDIARHKMVAPEIRPVNFDWAPSCKLISVREKRQRCQIGYHSSSPMHLPSLWLRALTSPELCQVAGNLRAGRLAF